MNNIANLMSHNKRLIYTVAATIVVLLVPFVAMQFTNEVTWSLADFVAAGGPLLGAGLLYELVTRIIRNSKQRIIVGFGILVVLIVVWVELAVGIFD